MVEAHVCSWHLLSTGRALQAECDDLEMIGLALLYPALERSVCAPGHHGYPRTSDLILKGPERPLVPPDHGCDGETVSPSPQSNSQTAAGILVPGISPWVRTECLRCSRLDACFVAACLHQHGPGDPRQLVSKGSSQHVVMQAVCRGCQPRAKTVLHPVCRPEQNNAGTLHEERPQIAIATFSDAAKMVRSPVDICFGIRPSHAAKSRPFAKAVPLPIAATIALAMIGPTPGTVINWRQLSLPCARTSISAVMCSIRSSRRRQSPLRSSMILIIRGDNTSLRLARMSGSCWRRKRSP